MNAIQVKAFGGPEVLQIAEVSTPELPYTPGTDGAGLVEGVGADVRSCKPGDRVYLGGSVSGTCAEHAPATEAQMHDLPKSISFPQGAGVNVPYATAYGALHRFAHVRAGESLLIHGASGGVGIAAAQVARALGMSVIGTAGSDGGRELATREGAHHVVDRRAPGYQEKALELTGGGGFDVILEMLANVNLGADLKLLAMHGRVVVIGSRGEVTINPRDLMGRDAAVFGMLLWNISAQDAAITHAAIVARLENGSLRPVIGKELPLSEAAEAHRKVMEAGAFGQIMLAP